MRRVAWPVMLAALLALPRAAPAEPFLDVYGGRSLSRDADLKVHRPGAGDDYRIDDVAFRDESFEAPPYYGIRAGLFLPRRPWLGVAVEMIHFKMLADTGEVRRLTGIRGGAPVDAHVPVGTVVESFAISHGVNYVTADLLARLAVGGEGPTDPRAPVQLYAGLGAGPVIAHPENRIEGAANRERYETAGVGVQAFAGARFVTASWLGLFAEAKVSASDLEVGVAGGRARLEERTLHVVAGISVRWPP